MYLVLSSATCTFSTVWVRRTAFQEPVVFRLTIHNISTCASCGALFSKQWSRLKEHLDFIVRFLDGLLNYLGHLRLFWSINYMYVYLN